MLKRIICTFLLFLLGLGISTPASAADRYKWITSTDKVTISYDTQTVHYNSTNGKTVDVWIIWQYTEDGAKDFVGDMRAKGLCQESKWDNFSYDLNHYLVSKNSFAITESISYDHNGRVLFSYTKEYPKWNTIPPNTIGEAIRDVFNGFLKS